MKFVLSFLLVFIFNFITNAQFIAPVLNYDQDYSDNIINNYSVGNLGFDAVLNTYNPNFVNSSSTYFIHSRFISNINQFSKVNEQKALDGEMKLYPDFIFQFQKDWFGVQVSYINNIISDLRTDDISTYITYNPNNFAGPAEFFNHNAVIQVTGIVRYGSFSFSLGALTNNFETKIDVKNSGHERYQLNFFDNVQFYAGINYSVKDFLKSYINFKSENLSVELNRDGNIPHIYTKPTYYIKGTFGLGLQLIPIENLGVSLEANYDYVDQTKTSNLFIPGSYSMIDGISNTRIITGVNYKINKNFKCGILFSKYLIYKVPYFMNYKHEAKTNPFQVAIATSYKLLKKIGFNLSYQYSKVEFDRGTGYIESHSSQYLSFGIGYEL